MKALVCRGFGSPPTTAVESRPDGELGPSEIAIDVEFGALNFTDVLMLKGEYQDKPTLPFVPGLDASGVVSGIGCDVKNFELGQRVISSGVVGAFSSRLTAES